MRGTLVGIALGLFWLALAVYAVAFWLALAAPLLAAPAPRPRAKVRPPIPGEWVLIQQGQRYEAQFFRDGVWVCWTAGTPLAPGGGPERCWVGAWKLDGDRLECTEQYMIDGEPSWRGSRWVAELEPGTLRGAYRLDREGAEAAPFALERPKARR